jgi:hypothetical protein
VYLTFAMTKTGSLYIAIFLLGFSCNRDSDGFPPSEADAIRGFKQYFDLDIDHAPLVYNDLKNLYTSTVYLDESLYRIYFYPPDGRMEALHTAPLIPGGVQKVLCVVRLSDELIQHVDSIQTLWENAQRSINLEHEFYAQVHGLLTPVVVFENHNFYLSQAEFAEHDPLKPLSSPFIMYASQHNINLREYDVLVRIDLDLKKPGGGMGYYFQYGNKTLGIAIVNWIYPDNGELSQVNFDGLAYAAYHHEIGHSWGWEHEWSGLDYAWGDTLITDPALFGWTDLDGDGVVEIIDETPYGLLK